MNLLTLDFQVLFRELDEIFRKLLNVVHKIKKMVPRAGIEPATTTVSRS